MEAAEEIALQLALRNISGIIIVDFINMKPEEHNKKLMSHFGNLLKQDAVRTELMDITALGLVEITRMKTSKPLREQLMEAVFFNESKTVPQPKGEKT
jgi:ribonuclease G